MDQDVRICATAGEGQISYIEVWDRFKPEEEETRAVRTSLQQCCGVGHLREEPTGVEGGAVAPLTVSGRGGLHGHHLGCVVQGHAVPTGMLIGVQWGHGAQQRGPQSHSRLRGGGGLRSGESVLVK